MGELSANSHHNREWRDMLRLESQSVDGFLQTRTNLGSQGLGDVARPRMVGDPPMVALVVPDSVCLSDADVVRMVAQG